jgi:diguanylate cyclase (GGDEF)-like protein
MSGNTNPPYYEGKEADSDITEALVSESYVRSHAPTTGGGRHLYRPVLVLLSGVHRGARFQIDRPQVVLGRSSECDIQLTDVGVSRRHLRIHYDNCAYPEQPPKCRIEDLGSRNGTAVNGKLVEGIMPLKERDRISVGRISIGFVHRNADELSQDQTLYESATRDSLTGLENRQQLTYVLRHHLSSAARRGFTISLLLVDIDHFKSVNDTHGHGIGDLALQHAAAIIKKKCRAGDMAARWGGEEFALVLPGASIDQALEAAERLRRSVEQTPLAIPQGPTLNLTISIGVASTQPADTVETLFSRADEALYQAKRNGRNRVIASQPPTEDES